MSSFNATGGATPASLKDTYLRVAREAVNLRNAQNSITLLGLPAEIQNMIYESALVEEHSIAVQAGVTQQPALLEVCRTIRKDAAPIYYSTNRFNLLVQDWDGVAFAPFLWTMLYHHATPTCLLTNVTFDLTRAANNANWTNLTRWMKVVHARKMVPPFIKNSTPRTDKEFFAVFVLFRSQMEAMQHLPWEQVEKIMEQQQILLGLIDSAWLDCPGHVNAREA